MPTQMTSNCCNAQLILNDGNEGTCWYTCEKCGKACDQMTSNKRDSLRKILGELIELIHKYPMESEADLIDIVVNKYRGKNEN